MVDFRQLAGGKGDVYHGAGYLYYPADGSFWHQILLKANPWRLPKAGTIADSSIGLSALCPLSRFPKFHVFLTHRGVQPVRQGQGKLQSLDQVLVSLAHKELTRLTQNSAKTLPQTPLVGLQGG
jgi:hypothetical protein